MAEYALKLSDVEVSRYRFMAESAAQFEADLWAAAGVVEGATIADVGCGPGAVSVVLAQCVGPEGRVIAVDRDPEAVENARQVAAQAGVENVAFSVGPADDTGIEPASADVVMIRHVLAHNGGREAAIVAHAASLVRPGGWVYLADIEAEAFRIRPSNDDYDDLDARYKEWHRRQGNDLSVGLRLGELLTGAGLEAVAHQGRYRIISVPPGLRPPSWAAREALLEAGLATPDDVARWAAAFDRDDAAPDRATLFVPLFFAYARRPAGK
jgi:ubiquinone/menaquinone biosynthesis C-methylase UbiE